MFIQILFEFETKVSWEAAVIRIFYYEQLIYRKELYKHILKGQRSIGVVNKNYCTQNIYSDVYSC